MGHPAQPNADLGEPLEFMRAIWGVDHALAGLSRAMESRLGLTGPQRLVVRVVGRIPGIAPSALARLLHLDPSTLSGHVNVLTKKGILARKRTSDDARRFALTLTAQGKKLDVSMPGTLEAAVHDLDASFARSELLVARRIFEALAASLRAQTFVIHQGAATARPRRRRRRA